MKWEGQRESDNVEDRRDDSGDGGGGGGGGGGGIRVGHIGLGTVLIALVASYFLGINPMTVLGLLSGGGSGDPVAVQPAPPATGPRPPAAQDRQVHFVRTILASTEDVWKDIFSKGGAVYKEPKLELFRGSYPTACGQGLAAMGPFYCPGDQKVYIDLGFYDTLRTQLGAPGEFAQAYVIAHEVGHHVQNLLGVSAKVQQARERASKAESNALSVRLELQADCLAGVWAHHSQKSLNWLEQGDIESAMNAAAKIGDDALQRGAGRAVVPESFTHGSSAQRTHWFNTGLQNGSVKGCDTFSAPQP
jgi:predicted metalloprotease